MLDCSDGLYFDPAPVPRRRLRTVPISVVFEGVGGSLIVGPIGRVPPPTDPPLPDPPWQRRVMDAANWVRLFEWAWEKAQAITDWIAGTGLFRQRVPQGG